MASLSQRALDAAIDAGVLSKSEIATVNGLRSGGGSRVAYRRLGWAQSPSNSSSAPRP
jgi:hypothetical protein